MREPLLVWSLFHYFLYFCFRAERWRHTVEADHYIPRRRTGALQAHEVTSKQTNKQTSLWGNEQTNKQTDPFSFRELNTLFLLSLYLSWKRQPTLWLFTFTLNLNLECFRFEKIFIHVFIYTIYTCIWNVIQAWKVRITARILCFIHAMIVNNCVFQIILPFEGRSQASYLAHDFSSPLFHIPPSPPPSSQEFD